MKKIIFCLTVWCFATTAVIGDTLTAYYVYEKSTKRKLVALKNPIPIIIPLPQENWDPQQVLENSFRYVKSNDGKTEKLIELTILDESQRDRLIGESEKDPLTKISELFIKKFKNISPEFKVINNEMKSGYRIFVIEGRDQTTSSICWIKNKNIFVFNFTYVKKSEYKKTEIIESYDNIQYPTEQEFDEKFKIYLKREFWKNKE